MKLHFIMALPLIFLLTLSLHSPLHGQDPPIEWGLIPLPDLKMESYSADPNAAALILCDYGESSMDNNFNLVYERHMRVKILTTKGYEWATQSIVVNSAKPKEFVHGIEGTTYWLGDNGEVMKAELQSSDIFREEVNDKRTRYRFTLPALKPGCVIEYRYSISTEDWFLIRDWDFQYSEPALWSEYRVVMPPVVMYGGVTFGYETFAVKQLDVVKRTFSGSAKSYFGHEDVSCNQMQWAVSRMPALRDEPYITTLDDYRQKVVLQLSEYASRYESRKVLDTWANVVKELIKDEQFGERIDVTKKVRILTDALIAGTTDPEEKMKRIYDWISSSIVWSGENRFEAKQEVNDVLESKKGNNAEITFLLLSMLKSAGISAEPVILSTRSNGKIHDVYPVVSQFNYVLARAAVGSTKYLLDATDPLRPIDLLPVRVLNVRGLVIRDDTLEWITFHSPKRGIVRSLADVHLRKDGSLFGYF